SAAARHRYAPEHVVILGGGHMAEAIERRLTGRGSRVTVAPLDADPARVFEGSPRPDVVLLAGVARLGSRAPDADLSQNWPWIEEKLIQPSFRLLQQWAREPELVRGKTLSAVTALGGGSGFFNARHALAEGGAV